MTAYGHCVACIDAEIDKGAFELARVGIRSSDAARRYNHFLQSVPTRAAYWAPKFASFEPSSRRVISNRALTSIGGDGPKRNETAALRSTHDRQHDADN